ncbi:reverse transcriptase domain-containing protein [Pseudomonas sp. KB-10]|uniref:reverse transcriptase domain-containing protein n=1 Tax=Pseudomonas sp. KB-10 TaxID=2292264 RepID=UPI001BAFE265
MSRLYKDICSHRTLYNAWRKVRSSAAFSNSEEIRLEAEAFESRLPDSLTEIQRALSKKEFVFLQQTGVAQQKASGKVRPLVLAPIPNRIVQRALLDALQRRVKFVQQVLAIQWSYGGLPNKRVSMAIEDAKAAMRAGARFHIRSDIPAFFTKIDKERVRTILAPHIRCPDTLDLFDAAVKTDLANIDDLRRRELDNHFPIGIIGVAQGSPLSPLLANIYLADFDALMNSKDVVCLRYIDDFLILGKSQSDVDRAFNRAQKALAKLSLNAYDPTTNRDKASRGPVNKGFDFLGCNVSPGLIQPSEATRKRFKTKLSTEFEITKRCLHYNAKYSDGENKYSYASMLYRIDKIILGWGKAFSFCNGSQTMAAMDAFISDQLMALEKEKNNLLAKAAPSTRRRILGIRLLTSTKAPEPASS